MAPRKPDPPDHSAVLDILNYENGSSAANEVTLVDFYQYFYNTLRFNILPDGRIVVCGANKVVIYPDPLLIASNESKTLASSHVLEIPGFPMVRGFLNMSKWYFGQESSIAVFGNAPRQMVVAWIPHDGAPPMNRTIEKYMPTFAGRSILGLFLGVTMITPSRISLFSYPWGEFQSEVGVKSRKINVKRDPDDDTYDVDKGSCRDVEIRCF
ncbi:hypothetical protein AGABI2DRAFT_194446, partial [Agaricus bisporus var. bisporus H97]|uniref:hypothetical protein n=1 Tax=Agaricus bisporus var. bisporus (strain H97 / ATCC MYA-4626 / FGSC 10389) TaxID=936046 RepID=UPI00029F60E7